MRGGRPAQSRCPKPASAPTAVVSTPPRPAPLTCREGHEGVVPLETPVLVQEMSRVEGVWILELCRVELRRAEKGDDVQVLEREEGGQRRSSAQRPRECGLLFPRGASQSPCHLAKPTQVTIMIRFSKNKASLFTTLHGQYHGLAQTLVFLSLALPFGTHSFLRQGVGPLLWLPPYKNTLPLSLVPIRN